MIQGSAYDELLDGLLLVRITRLPGSERGNTVGIHPSEWRAVAAADPSLELTDSLTGIDPQTRQMIEVHTPHAARWLAHPEAVPYVFQFRLGEVVAHSGDRHVVAKAQSLASALNAHVVVSVD